MMYILTMIHILTDITNVYCPSWQKTTMIKCDGDCCKPLFIVNVPPVKTFKQHSSQWLEQPTNPFLVFSLHGLNNMTNIDVCKKHSDERVFYFNHKV